MPDILRKPHVIAIVLSFSSRVSLSPCGLILLPLSTIRHLCLTDHLVCLPFFLTCTSPLACSIYPRFCLNPEGRCIPFAWPSSGRRTSRRRACGRANLLIRYFGELRKFSNSFIVQRHISFSQVLFQVFSASF